MTKTRWAATLTTATAAVFVVACTATIVRLVRLEPQIRRVRGPGLLGVAGVFAAIALFGLASLRRHRVLVLASAALVGSFLLGAYSSESLLAPVVGVSLVTFLIAFRLRSAETRFPGGVRTAAIVLAVALGSAALIALHMNPKIVTWNRVREAGRTVEVTVNTFDGTCGTMAPHEVESPTTDAGCQEYVPHQPARAAMAFAAACALMGLVAAGPPVARRIED